MVYIARFDERKKKFDIAEEILANVINKREMVACSYEGCIKEKTLTSIDNPTLV